MVGGRFNYSGTKKSSCKYSIWHNMSNQANKIIRWVYIIALVLAILRLFQLPFVTPIYAVIIFGIGFMFSPVYFLTYSFSKELNFNVKVFTTGICFMVSLVCANTVLFQFQTINTTFIFTGLGVCLFLFSEFWWYRKKDSLHNLANLHRLSWWFIPLIIYPFVYRFVPQRYSDKTRQR